MIMKIFSSFGEHVCEPGILQAIDKINSTVTADNQDSESASDSCCDFSEETPF